MINCIPYETTVAISYPYPNLNWSVSVKGPQQSAISTTGRRTHSVYKVISGRHNFSPAMRTLEMLLLSDGFHIRPTSCQNCNKTMKMTHFIKLQELWSQNNQHCSNMVANDWVQIRSSSSEQICLRFYNWIYCKTENTHIAQQHL